MGRGKEISFALKQLAVFRSAKSKSIRKIIKLLRPDFVNMTRYLQLANLELILNHQLQ